MAKSGAFGDLGPRFLSALVLGAIAFVAEYLGGWVFAIFVSAAVAIMIYELTSLVAGDADFGSLGAVGWSAAAVAPVFIAELWSSGGLLAALGIGAAAFFTVAGNARRPFAIALTLIAFAGAALVFLREGQGGFWLVLWLVLCVIAADAGGYFCGKLIGGAKLWPALSPKKTWAGFLGGFALSLLVATIFAVSMNGSVAAYLAFGALIAAAALAGDLAESALKRRFGAKDAGTILPGHGGLMDRFDGLGAVAILFGIIGLVSDLQAMLGSAYVPPGALEGGL